MALKTGITCCVRGVLGLTKPALSSAHSPVLNSAVQKCYSSTLKTLPYISHNALHFGSSNPSTSSSSIMNNNSNNNNGGSKLKLSQQMSSTPNICVQQIRNYHSVLRPRLHCKGCYFVWRHGRKYVECSDMPSHKQMKKVLTRKLWKEDYTKGNVRKAMNWNRDLMRISDRMCDRDVLSHDWMASRIGNDV